MRNPSHGVPCDRSCTSMLWSFSVSQGLHLHLHASDQARGSSPKALRKYDFRLLAPHTVGAFHRRRHAGSGMASPVTRTNGSLMGYRMVWRTCENGHHDTLDRTSPGNPVLHLYLPSSHADSRKEADDVLDAAGTERKIGENQIQERPDVWNDEDNGNRDVTGGNGAPDVVGDVVTTETGSERKHETEEDDDNCERRRGSQNELVEKEQHERHGGRENGYDVAEERSAVGEEGLPGKSGDAPRLTAEARQCVFEERQNAPATKLKSGAAHVRNPESKSTRRLTLPAPALSFPGTLARARSSPSPCVLPSFYGPPFGRRARTPRTPECHRADGVSFDKRSVKPAPERPPSLDRRGSRHILKTEPRGTTGLCPKIMSSECWGCLSRKTKTTKTFVWGPRGPQETKSVCELHTRTNRWRGLD
ncbi:uncharacterized protein LOC108265299 isoform X4 [Ictalurus punctatus]|uniref:Uncharacterized protein LOC108265299 isoform X4 n=1 Tax=Ictalurus punctatus TaxID=7998 RepID=A0A2D0QX20_ICTPU|nr:uncharacterized protein LOC108265299 isoform X4 [Ictalurus punctatus]